MGIIKRLLLYGSAGIPLACQAADNMMLGPPPAGKQIMVYVRQTLGGHGALRVYGLRLEQASIPSTSPAASITSLTRRRELLNFEYAPHADMRLAFGRRLIWDVGRHEFGLGSVPAYTAFHLWSDGTAARYCEVPMACLNTH